MLVTIVFFVSHADLHSAIAGAGCPAGGGRLSNASSESYYGTDDEGASDAENAGLSREEMACSDMSEHELTKLGPDDLRMLRALGNQITRRIIKAIRSEKITKVKIAIAEASANRICGYVINTPYLTGYSTYILETPLNFVLSCMMQKAIPITIKTLQEHGAYNITMIPERVNAIVDAKIEDACAPLVAIMQCLLDAGADPYLEKHSPVKYLSTNKTPRHSYTCQGLASSDHFPVPSVRAMAKTW